MNIVPRRSGEFIVGPPLNPAGAKLRLRLFERMRIIDRLPYDRSGSRRFHESEAARLSALIATEADPTKLAAYRRRLAKTQARLNEWDDGSSK